MICVEKAYTFLQEFWIRRLIHCMTVSRYTERSWTHANPPELWNTTGCTRRCQEEYFYPSSDQACFSIKLRTSYSSHGLRSLKKISRKVWRGGEEVEKFVYPYYSGYFTCYIRTPFSFHLPGRFVKTFANSRNSSSKSVFLKGKFV